MIYYCLPVLLFVCVNESNIQYIPSLHTCSYERRYIFKHAAQHVFTNIKYSKKTVRN